MSGRIFHSNTQRPVLASRELNLGHAVDIAESYVRRGRTESLIMSKTAESFWAVACCVGLLAAGGCKPTASGTWVETIGFRVAQSDGDILEFQTELDEWLSVNGFEVASPPKGDVRHAGESVVWYSGKYKSSGRFFLRIGLTQRPPSGVFIFKIHSEWPTQGHLSPPPHSARTVRDMRDELALEYADSTRQKNVERP